MFHHVRKALVTLPLLFVASCGITRPSPSDEAPLVGKVRIVNVGAIWCSECVYEMNALERIQGQSERVDVSVFLLDGTEEAVNAFRNKHSISLPLLFDRTGAFQEMFHITSVPKSLVYGCDGKLRAIIDDKLVGSMPAELHQRISWAKPEGTEYLRSLLNENSCRKKF